MKNLALLELERLCFKKHEYQSLLLAQMRLIFSNMKLWCCNLK